jgi:uncharacterized damage-inducible protein DinB
MLCFVWTWQEVGTMGQMSDKAVDKAVDKAKASLLSRLNRQREHVLGALEGLSAEELRRPELPTGWNCLGLVNHLAFDVERFWFRDVMAGEALDHPDTPENAWQVGSDTSAESVLGTYRQEIERANAIIASTPLDAAPRWWPDFFGSYRLDDHLQVMLHVIAETACHAGHLDAVRELIDGKTWLILT